MRRDTLEELQPEASGREGLFPLEVRYEFKYAADGVTPCGIRILPEDATGEGVVVVQCWCAWRDRENFSRIKEDATYVNPRTNAPLLRSRILCDEILLTFFHEWNLGDGGQLLEITPENVGGLHDALVEALAFQWLKMTG